MELENKNSKERSTKHQKNSLFKFKAVKYV